MERTNEKAVARPRMMTVREVAATGLLPEHALRVMLKKGTLPAVPENIHSLFKKKPKPSEALRRVSDVFMFCSQLQI